MEPASEETTIDLSSAELDDLSEPAGLGPEPSPAAHAEAVQSLAAEMIRWQRMVHTMKARIAHSGPPGVEAGALGMLAMLVNQGAMRQGDLATCVGLDPSTVSRHVRQLVGAGLVERRPDPGDGRAVQLAVTAPGQAAFERMRSARLEFMAELLSDWAPAEIVTLSRLIGRLADAAITERPSGSAGPDAQLDLR